MDPISDLAEQLAGRIRRSVTVYDADLRLLGYSSHYGDADALRLNSLVSRRLEGPVREVAIASRFRSWREPFRRPALHAHGHEHDRISFPIRSRYEFLGFVCVIDDEGLSEAETRECLDTAERMEHLLSAEADFNQDVEDLLSTLLSDDPRAREVAMEGLRGLGIFPNSTEVTAMTMTVGSPDGDAGGSEYAAVVRRALKLATTARLGRSATSAVLQNRAFLLIGGRGSTPREEYVDIAQRISAELSQLEPALAQTIFFGVGTPAPLAEAFVSHERATVAERIAARDRRIAVFWEDHPLDALLAATIVPQVAPTSIPPVLHELVASQSAETTATVAGFLDEAGNVARLSEKMNLHRTTVYYRLRQFEKSTGLDLDDGRHRLLLHLWLVVGDRIRKTPLAG